MSAQQMQRTRTGMDINSIIESIISSIDRITFMDRSDNFTACDSIDSIDEKAGFVTLSMSDGTKFEIRVSKVN